MQNCQVHTGRAKKRMYPQGTNEEVWMDVVKCTVVEEEASPLGRCPPWKKLRSAMEVTGVFLVDRKDQLVARKFPERRK